MHTRCQLAMQPMVGTEPGQCLVPVLKEIEPCARRRGDASGGIVLRATMIENHPIPVDFPMLSLFAFSERHPLPARAARLQTMLPNRVRPPRYEPT